ncbi:heme-thiolate peroxidase [Crepidotus variabilis]|uniref:Heme-thiolate peroxidase n=1 Tax=Crepidotus variabilis TaxID=179855 RepID=A0A9P6EHG9_9AGAR|nr:heme-thiolate peroxidase [Crepidotus variabilis]
MVFSAFLLPALVTVVVALPAFEPGTWKPAGPGDSRAPCPLLNTLANHNLINHNGKNISFAHLNETLGNVVGMEAPLRNAILAGPIQKLGDTFDLHDVALHGDFEHDASLVHDDVATGKQYAPVTVNQTKVVIFKSFSANGKVFTAHDIAAARVSIESDYSSLSDNAVSAGVGEPALVTLAFGSKKDESWVIPVESMLTLLGKERLPNGFVTHDFGLEDLGGLTAEITNDMQAIRAAR